VLSLPLSLGVGAAFVASSPGCVEEDPVITGHRDAASDVRIVPEVIPGADSDEDGVDCARCAETLSTERPMGTLCRKNGDPSSARRRSTFVDCACYDKCVEPCAAFCGGAARDKACEACLGASCTSELDACVADKR
jgi:hypothetical protein